MAVPSLRLIRRQFPNSEVRILANEAMSGIASVKSVLAGSGLADGFLEYESGSAGALLRTWRKIREWRPQLVIYMMPVRTHVQLVRDWLFFASAGAREIVGLSLREASQHHCLDPVTALRESEASRLLRNLRALGTIDLTDQESWTLGLTQADRERATELLGSWPGRELYIACAIGTKVSANDWGLDRWTEWARMVSSEFPDLGLIMLGTAQDSSRSSIVANAWHGPVLNLCGLLAPRETASAIEKAVAFAGHDSGPLHLAAAVGTPAIAIFSARNEPGIWFPFGGHRNVVIYHKTACHGCKLSVCDRYKGECIRGISAEEAVSATRRLLQREAPLQPGRRSFEERIQSS